MTDFKKHPASYRDPAGFVFELEGKFYRQVNQCYAANYQLLKTSGLYDALVKDKKLLPHSELDENLTKSANWFVTLYPEQLLFVSYPYEWSFSQWKEAALLTLDLVNRSMDHGMILKDATPFNVQFINCRPVFIDSLSFEKYDESKPWVAYRQFTECFLAPLLLAHYDSPELFRIFQTYPEGIPLSVLIRLLPIKATMNFNVLLHVFLPIRLSGKKNNGLAKRAPFTKKKLLHIIKNLESFVNSLAPAPSKMEWYNYYEETVLSAEYVEEKNNIIREWIKELPVNTILDIGTNTGLYAQTTAAEGKFTIAVDADISCVDKLYRNCRNDNVTHLLPIYMDITNPSPGIGWDNKERVPFIRRARTDLTMALALIHHLVIGRNVEFCKVVDTFSCFSPYLIIEFIPKTDPKIALLLQEREDTFTSYNEESFLFEFQKKYSILKRIALHHSGRILFLMRRLEVFNSD